MGRVKYSLGMEILILLFVTLCAASDSELVLTPVGSEYQPASTKPGGEFSVKRQFTCDSAITANSLLQN